MNYIAERAAPASTRNGPSKTSFPGGIDGSEPTQSSAAKQAEKRIPPHLWCDYPHLAPRASFVGKGARNELALTYRMAGLPEFQDPVKQKNKANLGGPKFANARHLARKYLLARAK